MNQGFEILDWRRARRSLALGALFLALLLVVGLSSKRAEVIVDPLLAPGAAPFLWYFGGITETGPFGLVAFVLDVVVYAMAFYVLLTLKRYVAKRKPSDVS